MFFDEITTNYVKGTETERRFCIDSSEGEKSAVEIGLCLDTFEISIN